MADVPRAGTVNRFLCFSTGGTGSQKIECSIMKVDPQEHSEAAETGNSPTSSILSMAYVEMNLMGPRTHYTSNNVDSRHLSNYDDFLSRTTLHSMMSTMQLPMPGLRDIQVALILTALASEGARLANKARSDGEHSLFMEGRVVVYNFADVEKEFAAEVLGRLERVEYKEVSEGCCCSICLEDYGGQKDLVRLPCSHVYHGSCLLKWLEKKKRSCPYCRSAM